MHPLTKEKSHNNKNKIKLTLLNIKGTGVRREGDELIINANDIEGYVVCKSILCKDFQVKKHHRGIIQLLY